MEIQYSFMEFLKYKINKNSNNINSEIQRKKHYSALILEAYICSSW